jgi:hypothetical protein
MLQELRVAIRIHAFEKRNPVAIFPKNFHSTLATARSNSFRSDSSNPQLRQRTNSVSSMNSHSTLSTTSNNRNSGGNTYGMSNVGPASSSNNTSSNSKASKNASIDDALDELLAPGAAGGIVSLSDMIAPKTSNLTLAETT